MGWVVVRKGRVRRITHPPFPCLYAILPLPMYLIEVIPLSRKLPQETLSYLSRKPFARGDVVCAPLQTQTIDVLVIGSYSLMERKQEIRSISSRLRFLCNEEKKKNPFSPHYLNAVFSYADLMNVSPSEIIRVSTPKKMWEERIEEVDREQKSSYSVRILQLPYRERIQTLGEYFQDILNEDKSIHLIAPEREERVSLYSKFSNLLGKENVFLLDGKISEKKRESILERITQQASLVITSIPFLNEPLYNKSSLVLEQYNSDMYLTVRPPFINLRELLIQYAKETSIELILSDVLFDWRVKRSLKNVPDFFKKKNPLNHIHFIPYHEEQTRKLKDEERIEEILRKMREDSFLFNSQFERLLKKAVKDKKRIFLFAQKKHFSSNLVCLDCGNVIGEHTHRLTRDGKKIRFIHKNTGDKKDAPDFCPKCSSWRLKPLGVGSERLKEALEKLFPSQKIYFIDGTTSARERKKIIKDISEKKSFILVGTKQVFPFLPKLEIERLFIPSIDTYFYLRLPEQEEYYLHTLFTLAQHSKKTILQTRLYKRKSLAKDRGKKQGQYDFQNLMSIIKMKKLLKQREEKISQIYHGEIKGIETFTQTLPLWLFLSNKLSYDEYFSLLEKSRKKLLPIAIISLSKIVPQNLLTSLQQNQETFSIIQRKDGKIIVFSKSKNWKVQFPYLVEKLMEIGLITQLSFL